MNSKNLKKNKYKTNKTKIKLDNKKKIYKAGSGRQTSIDDIQPSIGTIVPHPFTINRVMEIPRDYQEPTSLIGRVYRTIVGVPKVEKRTSKISSPKISPKKYIMSPYYPYNEIPLNPYYRNTTEPLQPLIVQPDGKVESAKILNPRKERARKNLNLRRRYETMRWLDVMDIEKFGRELNSNERTQAIRDGKYKDLDIMDPMYIWKESHDVRKSKRIKEQNKKQKKETNIKKNKDIFKKSNLKARKKATKLLNERDKILKRTFNSVDDEDDIDHFNNYKYRRERGLSRDLEL